MSVGGRSTGGVVVVVVPGTVVEVDVVVSGTVVEVLVVDCTMVVFTVTGGPVVVVQVGCSG
jgi:hypothetical protein